MKAVVHVHESLTLPVAEPIALPKLNITWPKKVKGHVRRVLKLVDHVRVPLIDVEGWAKEDAEAEDEAGRERMQWGEVVSHPYMAAGSSSVAVIICVLVLGVNVYCLCCSARMKMLARVNNLVTNQSKGQISEASAPMMPMTHHRPDTVLHHRSDPMMMPMQSTLLNMAPPPPYPEQQVTVEPSRAVTVTPEQIARLIGFTPRRTMRAIDMG